jgi:hypothetical protein
MSWRIMRPIFLWILHMRVRMDDRKSYAKPLQIGNVMVGETVTAAVAASQFGSVLKISEDGLISFFQKGKCTWEI